MPVFRLILLKPSHYDDEGYVIQWWRSGIPSNTLAALYGMAHDAAERRVLGDDVELRISAIDETNTRIRVEKLARMIERDGGAGLVCLVGVQSNQFPRAMDIARGLRARGIQVGMGGFHVSGTLAMLPEITPELREAMDLSVSLYAGETEGRFDEFLLDAYAGRLKPLYNYLNDLPNIEGVAPPFMPREYVERTVGTLSSFDAGRGCPFVCSFCTIINVHGRKSRFRSPDDIERIVRDNAAQGIKRFFVTDDNFARNKNWEAIFDRLIALKEREGLGVHLTLQVDTQCHRIPRFIDKAARAGTKRIFIGLENINPDNLAAANKKQNKITEFRKMLLAWRAHRVFIDSGYILGFPGDTPESIRRDIEIIKRELPLDRLQFYCLTPLPGSADHKAMHERGEYMDPDLNNYELNHVTTRHPKMSAAEWHGIYREAWRRFYSLEHIKTLMRRGCATGVSPGKIMSSCIVVYLFGAIEGIQPLEAGLLRRRVRRDRRAGLPIENPFLFYPKYLARGLHMLFAAARLLIPLAILRVRLKRNPRSKDYVDQSLIPVDDAEMDAMEMYRNSDAATTAVATHRRKLAERASKPI
ncbi:MULTISPECIES: B12-binding domain-containing radical SAM protein [Thiorhodovibrio]|uniref:B12-binding domain-containing radical SAM protein n=1 Tax=Thiorhodovibrio TaxID=61593 RepID=UPI0019137B0D|nr:MULTISPECIES: radical SAM protein [Thiorhodovibrio]MBK5968456.1 radical SAM protein [Thiorhodovibrio winogradskyi]WPL11097.1 magnesium-protoporphyrin IX monomethyl ester anaerobic oxidative cyclase [Thiorhodovibrio litoralis]